MCVPASFVLTRDKEFFSKVSDSHEDIIKEFALHADGVKGTNILRVEICPVDGNMFSDPSTWIFKVDQSDTPEWANAENDEKRTREALKQWIASKIVTNGEHVVENRTVWAGGTAVVHAYGSSTVRAYGSSTVCAYNSSTIHAYNSSTVHAYNSSTVHAHDSSTVHAYNSSTVHAYNSSTVRAHGSSTIHAYNSSTVHAYNSSTVRAYDFSTVHGHDKCIIIAEGACGSYEHSNKQYIVNR